MTGKNKNIVAVVPAKGLSVGLPHKNMKSLGGVPLFWRSVMFADQAKIPCVAASDSADIRRYVQNYRRRLSIPVDTVAVGTPMLNQVRAALELAKADWFVILQPTSPFRQLQALEWLLDQDRPGFTCEDVKMQGIYKGEFRNQGDRQAKDTEFFHKFDGNILVGRREDVENGTLFGPDCAIYPEGLPYTIDIDDILDFEVAQAVMTQSNTCQELYHRVRWYL